MNQQSQIQEGPMTLDYHFSETEIKFLARFFRKNQEHLPDELLNFSSQIEHAIYNSMSIDEAEEFYS